MRVFGSAFLRFLRSCLCVGVYPILMVMLFIYLFHIEYILWDPIWSPFITPLQHCDYDDDKYSMNDAYFEVPNTRP